MRTFLTAASRTWFPALAWGLAAWMLAWMGPSPRRAHAQEDRFTAPYRLAPPAETRALTGGIVSLRTPGSPAVLIPRSTFPMGSRSIDVQLAVEACRREPLGARCNAEMFGNELTAHAVTLSPYWMDRFEVTVASYERCVDAGVCAEPPYDEGGAKLRVDDLPVVMITWNDAVAYCGYVGQRLPTEAEWERAARGPTGRRFPWGDQPGSRRANHGSFALDRNDGSDGFVELAPVGSYPDGRTPDGIADLAGNAAEWTADNYEDAYEPIPVTDPKGPRYGTFKAVRGGSYLMGMPWLRGAARLYRSVSTRSPDLGFRCAASVGRAQ